MYIPKQILINYEIIVFITENHDFSTQENEGEVMNCLGKRKMYFFAYLFYRYLTG